jgi:hypothetical protein
VSGMPCIMNILRKEKREIISQFNYLLPVLPEVVDDQAHP